MVSMKNTSKDTLGKGLKLNIYQILFERLHNSWEYNVHI